MKKGDRFRIPSNSVRVPLIPDTFIFSALCLTVFLLPLPYGAVEEWSIYAFEAVTLVLFAVHLIRGMVSPASKHESAVMTEGRSSNESIKRSTAFHILSALLAVFFFVVALQILPLPPSLVKIISPQAYDVAQKGYASIGTASPRFLTLSLSPALTSYELIKYICYFLFAFLVYRYARTRREIEIFVWVLLAAGLFQAVYGLTQLWGGTGRIFAWKNKYNQGSAFGTYINRDHFSGFLEMIFPLSIGYLLAKADFFAIKSGLSLKDKILWFSQERLQKTIILGLISVVMGLGIIFSRCRSGVFIFLITLFLMSMVVSAAGSRKRRSSSPSHGSGFSAKLVRTVAITVTAAAMIIGLNPIISRFTKESVTFDKGRAVFYKNSLELTNLFFLSGSGAGTFVHAYPLVEKEDSPGLLTHAHNDYLETLAETGVLAGGAIILAAFAAVGIVFVRWSRRRDPFVRGIVLGTLAGIVALLIHGVFDFNLRIPANAVYFFVLCALALRTVKLRSRA